MAGRFQISLCYKKLIISNTGYAMFYFIEESSGYIQIRILVAHVQNTSNIAVYTDHYTRSLPQASELFQTSKCRDSTVELVKVLPTSPIYAYPMPLHTWGLDSLIQWFHFWGLQLGIDQKSIKYVNRGTSTT